jgi:hypothetical protein
VLDALNTAGQALNRKEGLNNDIVRIGALPTAALGILPTVIGQFHKQQKDITLQVATMNNTMLLAGLKIRGDRYRHRTHVRPGADERAQLRTAVPRIPEAGGSSGTSAASGDRDPESGDGVAGGGLAKGTVPRQNAETLLQSQGCKMPAGCIETLSASLSRQLTVDFDYVWFVPSGAVKDDLRRGC